MQKLKEKHELLKNRNAELTNELKSKWQYLKGLKGNDYKRERLEIEPLRQEKLRVAAQKREYLVKLKQAIHNYKTAVATCSHTASDAKAKEEVAKIKTESADKED